MRTRAMTDPSAGLMEASSPPEGLGIQSPSQAPELTGSISNRSKTSFAVAVIVDLRKRFRKPGKGLGAGGESRSEEHTSELQSLRHLVCRLLLEKKTK